jgi:hypothetical protein
VLALPGHWVAASCHVGLGFWVEHPEPAPDQADSVQPRPLLERVSDVPPTAMT